MDINILILCVVIVFIMWFLIDRNYRAKRDRERQIQNVRDRRKRGLMEKYNHCDHIDDIVENIMEGKIWMGQTKEQVLDSIGHPAEIDEKMYKNKTKEVFKYDLSFDHLYHTRITLENSEVVGWDLR